MSRVAIGKDACAGTDVVLAQDLDGTSRDRLSLIAVGPFITMRRRRTVRRPMRKARAAVPLTEVVQLARSLVAVAAPDFDVLGDLDPRQCGSDERLVIDAIHTDRDRQRTSHSHNDVTNNVIGTIIKPSRRYSNGLTWTPRDRTAVSQRIVASEPVVVRFGPRSTPAINP